MYLGKSLVRWLQEMVTIVHAPCSFIFVCLYVLCLLPNDHHDRLQPPVTLSRINRYKEWSAMRKLTILTSSNL